MAGRIVLRPYIVKPAGLTHDWGYFSYCSSMPWGRWRVSHEPKLFCELRDVRVLECFATENVENESGVAGGCDVSIRHFLVAVNAEDDGLWWYNLQSECFDGQGHRCPQILEARGHEIVVMGYGFDVPPDVEVHIGILSGTTSYLRQGEPFFPRR
jgi:hypothetical protein